MGLMLHFMRRRRKTAAQSQRSRSSWCHNMRRKVRNARVHTDAITLRARLPTAGMGHLGGVHASATVSCRGARNAALITQDDRAEPSTPSMWQRRSDAMARYQSRCGLKWAPVHQRFAQQRAASQAESMAFQQDASFDGAGRCRAIAGTWRTTAKPQMRPAPMWLYSSVRRCTRLGVHLGTQQCHDSAEPSP